MIHYGQVPFTPFPKPETDEGPAACQSEWLASSMSLDIMKVTCHICLANLHQHIEQGMMRATAAAFEEGFNEAKQF